MRRWIAAGLLSVCVSFAAAQVLHVDGAHGNDEWAGDSWETALQTLAVAVERANLSGGTIWVAPGDYAVTNTLVLTNAISLLGSSGTPADTSIFRSATTAYSVIRISHSGALLAGFTVSNGQAAATGGGNLWLDGGGTVSNCWITRHSLYSGLPGGGIYNNNGRVTHCRVSDSRLSHWACKGAGIYQTGSDAVTEFSEIFDNACSGHSVLGAGIYLAAGEVRNCRITNNRNNSATSTSGGCGGGVYISGGRAVNCLIAGNEVGWNTGRASGGGGVYLKGGSLVNCTVVDNRAMFPGGGGLRFAGTAYVTNCIVAHNTSPETDTEEWRASRSTYARVAYSCLSPLTNGTFTACTASDPAFRDARLGDWRLSRGSPCEDTGVLLPEFAAGIDLLGNPRVDADGQVDMGGFENPHESGTLSIEGCPARYGTVTPPYGECNFLTNGTLLVCSAPGEPFTDGGARLICLGYSLVGLDNDGLVLSSNRSDQTSFTYTHTGRWHRVIWHFAETFRVELSATYGGRVSMSGGWLPVGSTIDVTADTLNPWCYFSHWSGDVPAGQEQSASLTLTVDRPLFLRAHFPVTLHVSDKDGDDAADGGTWEAALKSVARAVEHASLAGGTILVAPGDYAVTNTLVITNAISLLGTSGNPADTSIFRSATTAYSVIRITHSGAHLAGFTVSNGQATTCGGNVWLDGGGTVSNCWLMRHSVANGMPGGGIYNDNGRVTCCRISESRLFHWATRGVGLYQTGTDAVTEFSEIFNNGCSGHSVWGGGVYLSGGEMRNCTITSNRCNDAASTSGGCGGGLYISGGRAVSCLIACNEVGWNTSRASGGGGVYLKGGSLLNCTVVENRAMLPSGGGLYFAGTAYVTNCIVARNTSPETDPEEWRASNSAYAKVAYSRLTPLTNGTFTACIEADPAFEDADNGNWQLSRYSPCRNSGVLLAWLADQRDLLGAPRVDHRERIDMGAYERPYVPPETLLLIR